MTIYKHVLLAFLLFLSASAATSQTTAFTYQGKLQDNGLAANGTYQFEFRLFDAVSGGNQIGQTISNLPATVTNGIFAVSLDFGANTFSGGGARYIEIGVRQNGSALPYTALTPRQPVTSAPYAIRALFASLATSAVDAANLGGIPAAQYVITTDPRMSDDRNPLPDSPNYIQNGTMQQSLANFNIAGTGRANIFDVVGSYRIGGNRVLSAGGTENLFAGFGSGNVATGGFNAFFGAQSGKSTTTGASNSFFGAYAGSANLTGSSNSFFGVNSGGSNTLGNSNAFFGGASGYSNTTGGNNSYFGVSAGEGNSLAANNAMFGFSSGKQNVGGGNSFFGAFSGEKNTTGIFNSYFGLRSGKDTFTGSYNVYVGYETGSGNQGGSNNTFVGSATTGGGSNNTFVGYQISGGNGSANSALGYNSRILNGVSNAVAIGTNAVADESNAIVLGDAFTKIKVPGDGIWSFGSITTPSTVNASFLVANGLTVGGVTVNGSIQVGSGVYATGDVTGNSGYFDGSVTAQYIGLRGLNVGGNTPLCIQSPGQNPDRFISECSSSRRYKENIDDFKSGLDVVRRLRPVAFNWKNGGMRDVGFVAEEVNEIEPLLNNFNAAGEIEGVKYAQLTTVLVNAVIEQQEQIESLEDRLKRQEERLERLIRTVCATTPESPVCDSSDAPEEPEK